MSTHRPPAADRVERARRSSAKVGEQRGADRAVARSLAPIRATAAGARKCATAATARDAVALLEATDAPAVRAAVGNSTASSPRLRLGPAIGKPLSRNTSIIAWLSGRTIAVNVSIPAAAACSASCAEQERADAASVPVVGDLERDLRRGRPPRGRTGRDRRCARARRRARRAPGSATATARGDLRGRPAREEAQEPRAQREAVEQRGEPLLVVRLHRPDTDGGAVQQDAVARPGGQLRQPQAARATSSDEMSPPGSRSRRRARCVTSCSHISWTTRSATPRTSTVTVGVAASMPRSRSSPVRPARASGRGR